MAPALAKSRVSTYLPHAKVSYSLRMTSRRRLHESGRFLCNRRRLFRKLRYVLCGLDAGRVPPPRWYTVDAGMAAMSWPASFIRQHRSISSIWAKNSGSSPPVDSYTSVRTINAAPVAQKTDTVLSYCPMSFSTVSKSRPRQYG